jgi:hypothetical protein
MKRPLAGIKSIFTIAVMVLASVLVWVPGQAEAACSALPTDKGTVSGTVSVSTAGTYRVWSRVMATNTTDNTYLLQVDQTYCNVSVGGGSAIPANTWTWVNYQGGNTASTIDMTLSAGSHSILMAGYSPDLMVDRILFVTDTSCIPTGTGDNCSTAAPNITLTGVTEGQTVTGAVTVGAMVVNATPSKVEFFIDNTLYKSDTTSPYCMGTDNGSGCNSIDSTTIANGAHAFKATATYTGGTMTDTKNVTVSNAGSAKLGDVNLDNSVNIFDLSILLSHWAANYAAADFNHDSTVNIFDLSILLSHWGT